MSLLVKCPGPPSSADKRLSMAALGILQKLCTLLLVQSVLATAHSYTDTDDVINELDRPGEWGRLISAKSSLVLKPGSSVQSMRIGINSGLVRISSTKVATTVL